MVLWTTLKKIPNSRLCKLAQAQTHEQLMQNCDSNSIKNNEYWKTSYGGQSWRYGLRN